MNKAGENMPMPMPNAYLYPLCRYYDEVSGGERIWYDMVSLVSRERAGASAVIVIVIVISSSSLMDHTLTLLNNLTSYKERQSECIM